ncbi:MAG TPA: hypothetical protein ENJ33_04035 [Thiothrix sp.]|nr:hypothetical protein [Thiothrix sp.]
MSIASTTAQKIWDAQKTKTISFWAITQIIADEAYDHIKEQLEGYKTYGFGRTYEVTVYEFSDGSSLEAVDRPESEGGTIIAT